MNTLHNSIFNNLQNHQLNIKKYTKENVFRLHQFDTIALKLSKRNDDVYSKESGAHYPGNGLLKEYTAVLERFLHLDLECLYLEEACSKILPGGSWRVKKKVKEGMRGFC